MYVHSVWRSASVIYTNTHRKKRLSKHSSRKKKSWRKKNKNYLIKRVSHAITVQWLRGSGYREKSQLPFGILYLYQQLDLLPRILNDRGIKKKVVRKIEKLEKLTKMEDSSRGWASYVQQCIKCQLWLISILRVIVSRFCCGLFSSCLTLSAIQ